LTTEEGNLTPEQVGLLNLGDENSSTQVYKLKLNLNETKEYNLFEGEVIVCEGFSDTNARFNVNRIFKPNPLAKTLHDYAFLEKCQKMQMKQALQIIVAAGPYTTGDSLSYDALDDLLEMVRRDQPHVLILMGPFLDVANQALESGDISYKKPTTQEPEYFDYD
jgi:DNA polymerase alpha subunit B